MRNKHKFRRWQKQCTMFGEGNSLFANHQGLGGSLEPIAEKTELIFDKHQQHALGYHPEDKSFSIFASDFSAGVHNVPHVITIRIKSNNHTKDFRLSKACKDSEQETTHWIYSAVDGSGFSLTVWND